MKSIQRLLACWMLFVCLSGAACGESLPSPPPAEVGRLDAGSLHASSLLASALSLLEEGNFFIDRYNAITGSEVSAVFPLGMPYLWGGGYSHSTFSRAPGIQPGYALPPPTFLRRGGSIWAALTALAMCAGSGWTTSWGTSHR